MINYGVDLILRPDVTMALPDISLAALTSTRSHGSPGDNYTSDEVASDGEYVGSSACQQISDILRQLEKPKARSFGGQAHELPALPGLRVKGFGSVALPVRNDAGKLKKFCNKTSGNVWSLLPDQVELRNTKWSQSMQKLCVHSSRELGLKKITLLPTLSSVMVIREGSGIMRHRQVCSDERVIATLVIQLPSEYEGGDLVIFDDAEQSRYDLGRGSGYAETDPHYVVFSAGAEIALEEVTSGYRVLLMYSLLLPPHTKYDEPVELLRMNLVAAMQKLGGQLEKDNTVTSDEKSSDVARSRFALRLRASYETLQFESDCVSALQAVDRDLFQLMSEADALLPPNKKLKFYLVQALDGSQSMQHFSWYSIGGKKLGESNAKMKGKLFFLNEEDRTRSLEQGEFAIVGWPNSTDAANLYEVMGKFPGTAALLSETTLDYIKLRTLFACVGGKSHDGSTCTSYEVSLVSAQKLCQAIMDIGDENLIGVFLREYFPWLTSKEGILPVLAAFVREFGWDTVGSSIVCAIDEQVAENRMRLALQLAEFLKNHRAAQAALTALALSKVRDSLEANPSLVMSSEDVILLWRMCVASKNLPVFQGAMDLFQQMNRAQIDPLLDSLSECVDGSNLQAHRDGLALLATKRYNWLMQEISDIEKPFSWKIPSRDFPDAAGIVVFLKSAMEVLKIQGFIHTSQAHDRAAELRRKIKAPLEITVAGQDRDARVAIRKISGRFGPRGKRLPEYKAELTRLERIVRPNGASTTGTKHARVESPCPATAKARRTI